MESWAGRPGAAGTMRPGCGDVTDARRISSVWVGAAGRPDCFRARTVTRSNNRSRGDSLVMLRDDMKRVVEEQRLGYAATVCPDGTPNLSPRGRPPSGTTTAWASPTSALRARSRTCAATRRSRSTSSTPSRARGTASGAPRRFSRRGTCSIRPSNSTASAGFSTGSAPS
jgi:hypothetical protein